MVGKTQLYFEKVTEKGREKKYKFSLLFVTWIETNVLIIKLNFNYLIYN